LINTEHPRADAVLDPSAVEHRLIQSALETDVVRQLFRAASVEGDQFRARRAWHEGSAGAALENLAALYFGKSVHDLTTTLNVDPPQFERLLQARMDFFGGER